MDAAGGVFDVIFENIFFLDFWIIALSEAIVYDEMDTLFQSFHDWRDTSSQSLDWFFKENQTAKNDSFYLILVSFERSIYELGECLTEVA